MQPLNICQSYYGALKIVDNLSKDHDIDVQMSSDLLRELIQEPQQVGMLVCLFVCVCVCVYTRSCCVLCDCLHVFFYSM